MGSEQRSTGPLSNHTQSRRAGERQSACECRPCDEYSRTAWAQDSLPDLVVFCRQAVDTTVEFCTDAVVTLDVINPVHCLVPAVTELMRRIEDASKNQTARDPELTEKDSQRLIG